jgi:HAMP domain-containing protein
LIAAAFDRPERPVKILPGAPIKLADVPIGVKLATIFGGLFLVVAALGALSVLRIGMVNRAGDAIISNWLPGLQLAGEVLDSADAYRLAESSLVMSPDEDSISEYEKGMALALSRIGSAREALARLPTSAEEAGYIDEFAKAWNVYLGTSRKLVALVRQKQAMDAADLFTGESAYQFRKAKSFIARTVTGKVKGGGEAVSEADATYRTTIPIMIGAALVAALLCIGAAVGAAFGVVRPIRRMTVVVGDLAAGNLTAASAGLTGVTRGDEFGALARALAVLRDGVLKRNQLEREAETQRAGTAYPGIRRDDDRCDGHAGHSGRRHPPIGNEDGQHGGEHADPGDQHRGRRHRCCAEPGVGRRGSPADGNKCQRHCPSDWRRHHGDGGRGTGGTAVG